jgi:osmotically-inducible protein OsmY
VKLGVRGRALVLRGRVRSLAQREDARRAVAVVAGATPVETELSIRR